MKKLALIIAICLAAITAEAQDYNPGKPEKIYFNLYTDSIKTVVNYYVNVEGIFKGGRVLPLDANTITITADKGRMEGNEWIAPKQIDFDRVTFMAVAKENSSQRATITVYLQKWKDPRDDMSHDDPGMEMPVAPDRRRRR